jgi:hypothetical protein
MTWFETLTGFSETSPQQVRENIILDGETLTSRANGRVMVCGRLETPSLAELREWVHALEPRAGKLSLREVVADVQALHTDEANAGALFQVASQFNLLEMVSPHVTPEAGIGGYEYDHTQGPACAIAAGAGTLYRNYFAPVDGQIGQTADRQIDCLADLGAALGNAGNRLWIMQNGYALASRDGLTEIADRLRAAGESELDELRQQLRIGVQWNTQVTLHDCTHTVTQAYCSALPVAYSRQPAALWEPFARLVLEAAYEATILAAILNARATSNNRCYLTLLGGGAFGNADEWIIDAIGRALASYAWAGLDVAIVSYGASQAMVRGLVEAV